MQLKQKFKSKKPIVENVNYENDISIDRVFENETNNNTESVREIFSEKNIKVKSDLSSSQISKIARIYYMSKLLDMPELKILCDEFITLRISKDRKSRLEFVDGLKAKLDNTALSNGLNPLRQQFNK